MGIVLPIGSKAQGEAGRASSGAGEDIFVLEGTGQVQIFRATDVMLSFPRFVTPQAAKNAAPPGREYANLDPANAAVGIASLSESNPDGLQASALAPDEEPYNEKRFQARAALCTKIRALQRQTETELQRILPAFRALFLVDNSTPEEARTSYPLSERMDIATGSITTREATRLIRNHLDRVPELKEKRAMPLSAASLLATHELLMAHPIYFLADRLAHRQSQLFTCRSRDERELVHKVSDWVRAARGTPGYDLVAGFCERARRAREWTLARPSSDEGDPRELELDQESDSGVRWTDEDRLILAFLRASLGVRREIQTDPFGGLSMTILKRAGAHIELAPALAEPSLSQSCETASSNGSTSEEFSQIDCAGQDLQHTLVVRFLKDVGAFPPWQNVLRLEAGLRNIMEGDERGEEPTTDQSKDPASRALTPASDALVDAQEHSRHDFGSLPVYVIDDVGAHELDDGISVEPVPGTPGQWWVHVHIADPTAVLAPGDPLVQRAARRYSSIYFPDVRWALLPDEFVRQGVGLAATGRAIGGSPVASDNSTGSEAEEEMRKRQRRDGQRVLTFSAKVDERTGAVSDYAVRPGRVHDVRTILYDEVDQLLAAQATGSTAASSTSGMVADLSVLARIAISLSEGRTQNGAFFSFLPRTEVKISPLPLPHPPAYPTAPRAYTGFPRIELDLAQANVPITNPATSTSSTSSTPTMGARSLISELMLLAGRVGGEFARSRALPVPYRAQGVPENSEDLETLMSLRDQRTGAVNLIELLKRGIQLPAGYASEFPARHSSLGIDPENLNGRTADILGQGGYMRATSPLRRFPDLVAHWQFKSALVSPSEASKRSDSRPPWDRNALRELLPRFERMDVWVKSMQRAATNFWALTHLSRVLASARASGAYPPSGLGTSAAGPSSSTSMIESTSPSSDSLNMLGPHSAYLSLPDLRISPTTQQGRVKVHVLGLGLGADCEWGAREPVPPLGTMMEVRVEDVVLAGQRSALIVRRV